MYSGYGFRSFEIGDVDVIKHDGMYHLFHLTLPSHDYIAHAISEDGFKWRRVKNALFISDPREWDDDMLWTMHISPNPYRPAEWRMFYTGLCMRERGRVQRVGLAHSRDLYTWHKDDSGAYPLEITDNRYEHAIDEGRHWVSFRDPFCFQEDGTAWLLAAARVSHGPLIRRGCVALIQETRENQFEFYPPLFEPMHYDDIEVPNLVKISGRYYLIGSIREDVKVHYWYSDSLRGPYQNFHDNVLLPQGNYAARVSSEDGRLLIWNFFFKGLTTKGYHLMAPPKELVVDQGGGLRLKTYAGFDKLVTKALQLPELGALEPLFHNPHASSVMERGRCTIRCDSGFEAFLMPGDYTDLKLTGRLELTGRGKCGLVLRINESGDGYYLSLDLFKGIAQIRAWGHRPDGDFETAFRYQQLQAAHYVATGTSPTFSLIAYEQYLEFSLDGYVLLTLADDEFTCGRVGFYVESAEMRIEDLKLMLCQPPATESYPNSVPNF